MVKPKGKNKMTQHNKYPEEIRSIETERQLRKLFLKIGTGVPTKDLCKEAIDIKLREILPRK